MVHVFYAVFQGKSFFCLTRNLFDIFFNFLVISFSFEFQHFFQKKSDKKIALFFPNNFVFEFFSPVCFVIAFSDVKLIYGLGFSFFLFQAGGSRGSGTPPLNKSFSVYIMFHNPWLNPK